MERAEFAKLVGMIRSYYPRANFLSEPQDLEVWFRTLAKKDFREVAENMMWYVQKCGSTFPPSISDLINGDPERKEKRMIRIELKEYVPVYEKKTAQQDVIRAKIDALKKKLAAVEPPKAEPKAEPVEEVEISVDDFAREQAERREQYRRRLVER